MSDLGKSAKNGWFNASRALIRRVGSNCSIACAQGRRTYGTMGEGSTGTKAHRQQVNASGRQAGHKVLQCLWHGMQLELAGLHRM